MLALIFNIINRKYASKSSKKLTEKAQPTLKTSESQTPTGQSCLTLSWTSASLIHGHISCHHSGFREKQMCAFLMHFWSDSSVVKDSAEKSSNPIAVNNSGQESMIKVVKERKKKKGQPPYILKLLPMRNSHRSLSNCCDPV